MLLIVLVHIPSTNKAKRQAGTHITKFLINILKGSAVRYFLIAIKFRSVCIVDIPANPIKRAYNPQYFGRKITQAIKMMLEIRFITRPVFSLFNALSIEDVIWESPRGRSNVLPIVSSLPASSLPNNHIPISFPSIKKIGNSIKDIIIE